MANELTISGRIVSVLPLQQGESKAGKPWQKQEYILDTGGQYPRKVCFSLFGVETAYETMRLLVERTGKNSETLLSLLEEERKRIDRLEDKRTYKPKYQAPKAAPRIPRPLRGKPAKQQPYPGGDQHQINDRDSMLLTAGENER